MKYTLLLLFALFTFLSGAQPEYERPCAAYDVNDTYDIDQDGEPDVRIYVASEGTDDDPSSAGHCFYQLVNLNPTMGISAPIGWNHRSGMGGMVITDRVSSLQPSEQSTLSNLLSIGYGSYATDRGWTTSHNEVEYFGWYSKKGDETFIGWIELTISAENGEVKLTDSFLCQERFVIAGERPE